VQEALGRIVVEEQSHRLAIEEHCRAWLIARTPSGLAEPLAIEERLFATFWEKVERALLTQDAQTASAPEVGVLETARSC
jgi:hypothetical protein